MNSEDIAKICHEANRIFCASQNDFSQSIWDMAPAWQKQSAVEGVKYHVANPHATPEDSHKSWLNHKEQDGWIYGPVKDADKKEHPCMVPYNELPSFQQSKDYLYSSIVKSLIPFLTEK